MKKVTKRLLISVMILVAAVSLAATSTYAWFTMNDTPEVQGFELNVTAVDGLYISLSGDAGTYKSYITKAEIEGVLKAEGSEFAYGEGQARALKKLTHATTSDGTNFTIPSGVVQLRDDETTHVSFTLYFRSRDAYKVNLKAAAASEGDTQFSTVTSVHGPDHKAVEAWKTTIDGETYELGDDVDAKAENAVRIAFTAVTDPVSDPIFWHPNKDAGFSTNVALDYYNFVNGNATLTQGTIVNSDGTEDGTELLELEADGDTGYYVGELTISLWLEGWDNNALNSILQDIITTNLVFKGTLD